MKMGCCVSGNSNRDDREVLAKPKYSWEKEGRVDRSLLIVSKQEGGVVTRLPGTMSGKQFIVQECTGATILVLDHTETVTIDKCIDCHIMVAPCRTSVFLRDCTNCVCVIACQQLRTRDCKKCTLSLLSTTPPVIEASSKMNFSCYQCSYPQLRDQFDSAGLSVFNNSWSTVHDFTGGTSGGNWTVNVSSSSVDIDLPSEVADVGICFNPEESVVPLTVGPKQRPPDECCLVVFLDCGDSDEDAVKFVRAVRDSVTLVNTRRVQLASDEADKVFPDNEEMATRASQGTAVFLEVGGTDCTKLCVQAVSGDNAYVSPTPEQGQKDVDAFNSYLDINVGM